MLASPTRECSMQLPVHVVEHHLFALLTACSSNISRLSPADAEVFRNAFQQEAECYANSWLYLLRSTRNDDGESGYKFVGKETYMGIGYRNNTIYVVHPVGPGRFEETKDVVEALHQSIPYPIILKKVDQELYAYLSSTGLFQPYTDASPLYEEEAFPEHVLPLPRLYDSAGGLYHRSIPFTRKVRRFEKTAIQLLTQTDISGLESRPGFRDLFGVHPNKYGSYLQIIREVSSQGPNNDKYKACAYYEEEGTIRGLYIAERLKERSAGLYCAVVARLAPGMTEWMDHDFFQRVFDDGITTLYLGGSETAGVNTYVKKLLPIEPPYFQRPMYCNWGPVLPIENAATTD